MSVSSTLKWNSVLFSNLVATISLHESPSAHREFSPTFGLLDSNVPEYRYNKQKKEGEVRVDPSAISKIYNWDGQTLCS
jgi:hypothetical protein